jgi:hypothetical protein
MVRRVYSIGTTHVPETSRENRFGSARHRNLEAIWSCTLDAKRLWYAPSAPGKMDGPPGSSFGLYALKYAVRGTECEAMDQRIIHVASLDSCFAGAGNGAGKAISSAITSPWGCTQGRQRM